MPYEAIIASFAHLSDLEAARYDGWVTASELSTGPNTESLGWQIARWTLRVGVCLQAIGAWRWLTGYDDTPIFEWLWLGEEGGGLGWSEAEALGLQRQVGWVALACGLLTLVRPSLLTTGPLVLVEAFIVYGTWKTDYGFTLHPVFIAPHWERWYPVAAHACRVFAPLGLMLVDPFWGFWRRGFRHQGGSEDATTIRSYLGMQLLRLAVAATFATHGMEAMLQRSTFVDLLIDSAQRLLHWDLPQSQAEQALFVIGVTDLLLAGACLLTRSRAVFLWMATWGAITAVSRVTAGGLEYHWHETLWRASHCCVPLALAMYWQVLRSRQK
ncbi:hypothetical protein [Adhaeretor mobilis]|uniref:hypothetical protein n=1 Tax=Adhaeretor mobilis TaxID=1930276 RepID=UPI0011AA5BD4|nr:hypothetical protein [Adhaeretor mobilis]